MKRNIGMLLIWLLAICSLGVAQAKVDGKWAAEIANGRGIQMATIVLKNDGGKLTGTFEGGRGGAIPIQEGTVTGSSVKFKLKQVGRGGEVVVNYTGTISGDEIKFSRLAEGAEGMPLEFTAKRVQ